MHSDEQSQLTSLWLDRQAEVPHDHLPADGRFDDLVVGAGLTGLTTALLLARAGRRVGVVEARHVGAATTGHTTAKISLLQGTKLSTLRHRQPRDVAQAYVDSNREGMAWLLRFCEDHGVVQQRRDAVTYAADTTELSAVRAEHSAAASLGLDVEWDDRMDVPFPYVGATVLRDQAQLHPMELLNELVSQLRLHGGTVHESSRVVDLSPNSPTRVVLETGPVLEAEHVVLATGTPILDRGLHFAKLTPHRSYALAVTGAKPPPGMFLSAGRSARSVRDLPTDDVDYLLVGGAGHTVGRAGSTLRHLDELRQWTQEHFPGSEETHEWSAQDYSPYLGIPLVGRLPLSRGAVFVATGFDKWGMTNAVSTALTIASDILGGTGPVLRGRPLRPEPALQALRLNAAAAAALARGYARTKRDRLVPVAEPPAGEDRCRLIAVCTHLGGPLSWNDAEHSWDCVLHGSRFTADGAVLEGPATRPLRRRHRSQAD